MDMERCTGLMDPIIRGCGREEYSTAKGRCACKIVVLKEAYSKIMFILVIFKEIMIITIK